MLMLAVIITTEHKLTIHNDMLTVGSGNQGKVRVFHVDSSFYKAFIRQKNYVTEDLH